ncbi:MAG: glycoside hydrolase family 3 C-terminal domain-containing protein [Anaerolineales bacterium]|nr:glycoside hydrolase family 3 C-terminal domain-containing protein [Anaerolineales bacterium]
MRTNHAYMNPNLSPEERVADLLPRLTLAEKIGQMTQVEKNSIDPDDIARLGLGSILSGGGGVPEPNTAVSWRKMVQGFQEKALQSRLGIPLLYGVDAVHGHNNAYGATIFPHNIGLGATRNPDLVRRVARATAVELAATGIRWNFAPAVSLPQDIRWGRSYEGFSQDEKLVTELAVAYVQGLQGDDLTQETAVLPSVKHFVADGAAVWGTSRRIDRTALAEIEIDATLANAHVANMQHAVSLGAWQIDQGVSEIDEATLRAVHLPPYLAAIEAGALNIMISYSSWAGFRMHAHKYLLTDVLKGEFGFTGFLVSDWEGVQQIDPDLGRSVTAAINAGLDMVMVPYHYHEFMAALTAAVESGQVPLSRIDDAVRRILLVKFAMGLFERPLTQQTPLDLVGAAAHRALAAEAVQQSAVLLKNEQNVLPLSKMLPRLLVAGTAADDIGYQCGGWTISWMGEPGRITEGSTILQGIQDCVGDETAVCYSADGRFTESAEVGLVVIAEEPYAEGMGDRADLHLTAEQLGLLSRVRQQVDKLIVVLLSGRPLIITEPLAQWDAFVAAWLPGSEGAALAPVLFGERPFTGKLSFVWPKAMADIPLNSAAEPLWPLGFGLNTTEEHNA